MNTDTPSQIEVKEATNYFFPKSFDEEMPYQLDEYRNIKYYNIEKIFNLYFPENSLSIAKNVSLIERNQKQIQDGAFVYGEITFRSVAYIIEYLKAEYDLSKGVFYDLGSGTGKGILAAALCFPFEKCSGIEFLEGLNNIAQEMINQYNETFPEIFETNKKVFENFEKTPSLFCSQGNFLNHTYEDASLILANSTCFTSELMASIGAKLELECKPGTIAVTFSKELQGLSKDWEIRKPFKRLMSWGIASIYVHKRKTKSE